MFLFSFRSQEPTQPTSNSSSQPSSARSNRRKGTIFFFFLSSYNYSFMSKLAEKTTAPSFVFIIDDVTDPLPFNRSLDAVYLPVQFSITNTIQ